VIPGRGFQASRFDIAVMLGHGFQASYFDTAVMLGCGFRASRLGVTEWLWLALSLKYGLCYLMTCLQWFLDSLQQYMQPGLWICGGLIRLAMTGSLVSNSSILLMNVAIFASATTNNSIDKSPPLKAMDYDFLGFLELGSYWMDFLARSSKRSHPWFSSFCKNPLGTWFLTMSLFDNLIHHRDLALSPFLYTVVKALCQEIFESFKASPKRLIGFLFELHEVLSDQYSFLIG